MVYLTYVMTFVPLYKGGSVFAKSACIQLFSYSVWLEIKIESLLNLLKCMRDT